MKTADYRAAAAKAMPEDDLSELVRATCKTLGLFAYHTHISKFSASGYPDWHVVGEHGHLFRELKKETGKTTPAQDAWLAILARRGCDVGIWRPSQWFSGQIQAELVALTGRAVTP